MKSVPVEFSDGYDELLLSITKEVETKLECLDKRKTVEEIQKINETTPKKKSAKESHCQGIVKYCTDFNVSDKRSVKTKLNFG